MINIKLKEVSKAFKNKKILNEITTTFKEGQLTVLLGPSGCGKTTLLHLLTGYHTIDSGQLYFDSQLMNQVPMEQRQAPMVYQDLLLFPHLTVKENLLFPLKVKGMKKKGEGRKSGFSPLTNGAYNDC